MTGGEKEICLVLANYNLFIQIRTKLKNHFYLQPAAGIDDAVSFIRRQNVLSLIAHVADKTGYSPLDIFLFTEQFSAISIVAIADGKKFNLVFSCAKIGVREIVTSEVLGKIKDKLFLISEEQKLRGGGGGWYINFYFVRVSPSKKRASCSKKKNLLPIPGCKTFRHTAG